MDAQARNSIMPIKPEDWKKLGYSDSTIANDENEGLTNEIDPIFRYTHLSRAVPTWQTLTEAQYEELLVDIKPMLQLASLLIRSSPSLNADYDLYYSPRVHPKERVKSGSLPVLEYRHLDTTEPYWGERRDRANAALDRLAGVVDFRVVSEEENPEIEGVLAMTTSYFEVHPRGVNIQDDTDISKGAGSTIWINKMLLADLRRLRNEKGVDNTLKICSLWFKGAANLGHELFHAKFLATDSAFLADAMVEKGLRNYTAMRKFARKEGNAPNNEPLHEDDSDAELGYVWEKHIFGGHIQYTGYVNSCLFFSKWPSFWTSPTYHRRGGWRRKMTRYVVPMHYILNLQRQEFWDGMEDGNIETLLIKKWIGIREKCPQPKLVDPGWNTDDSSEDVVFTNLSPVILRPPDVFVLRHAIIYFDSHQRTVLLSSGTLFSNRLCGAMGKILEGWRLVRVAEYLQREKIWRRRVGLLGGANDTQPSPQTDWMAANDDDEEDLPGLNHIFRREQSKGRQRRFESAGIAPIEIVDLTQNSPQISSSPTPSTHAR